MLEKEFTYNSMMLWSELTFSRESLFPHLIFLHITAQIRFERFCAQLNFNVKVEHCRTILILLLEGKNYKRCLRQQHEAKKLDTGLRQGRNF